MRAIPATPRIASPGSPTRPGPWPELRVSDPGRTDGIGEAARAVAGYRTVATIHQAAPIASRPAPAASETAATLDRRTAPPVRMRIASGISSVGKMSGRPPPAERTGGPAGPGVGTPAAIAG